MNLPDIKTRLIPFEQQEVVEVRLRANRCSDVILINGWNSSILLRNAGWIAIVTMTAIGAFLGARTFLVVG